MQREGDDEAWRSIVENFGERAELDDEPDSSSTASAEPPTGQDPYGWAVAPEPDEPAETPSLANGEARARRARKAGQGLRAFLSGLVIVLAGAAVAFAIAAATYWERLAAYFAAG